MNWPNAKNLALIFLAVLNMFLGVLVYVNRANYRLSADAEQAITKLMSDNRIALTDVIPKEYAPMSQLMMAPCPADLYLGIFFLGRDDLSITLEYNKTIYRTDTEVLILQNGGASFKRVTANEPGEIPDEYTAVELCNNFIRTGSAGDFVLDKLIPLESGYCLEYRQIYKSNPIYSNYFIFEVGADGITSVRSKYDQVTGYENGRKDIISADRALFILMKYLIGEYEYTEIAVNGVDIVYIQPETSANADASLRAAPYYRFYYTQNDLPLLVNAYTGAIFDYVY